MARSTFSGIHEGEFWGISPTGRRIVVQHVHWWRFANGKTVEYRVGSDDLGMLNSET
jgi:predicted ester cyclase